MIEYTIELSRFLPFIGCKSGPSEWLEALSRATNPLKSIQSLEEVTYLLEDSQIYGLVYPAKDLISDRFFEEIFRKTEDYTPENKEFRFREQNENVKTHEVSEVTTIDILLEKEKLKAGLEKSVLHDSNRKKCTENYLKNGFPQAALNPELNLDFLEVEKKFPMESRSRKELLRKIINRHGERIENDHLAQDLGQGLKALIQALKSPVSNSVERVKRTEKINVFSKKTEVENLSQFEQDSFNTTEEYSSAKHFKNILSEKISKQFSKHIEGISTSSTSKSFLEEKLGKPLEPNQHSEAIFADHHPHNLKLLDSKKHLAEKHLTEKELIENKEFNVNAERTIGQFSRHIQGISISSASKGFFEDKLGNLNAQNPYISTDNTEYKAKTLELTSSQLSERISKKFDRSLIPESRISENKRKLDALSLANTNLLIEEAYSNNKNKTNTNVDNREFLLNLMENISQVITQNNRDTALSKQNIFNIHVSGENPTGEKDLKNLSDRLVLILKDQARRHGIDLS